MILVAPTAYKGTIGAADAAHAMAAGVRRVLPGVEVREMPLADGGHGLIDALEGQRGRRTTRHGVTGPLGEPVPARALLGRGEVVVETADACGLHLVPEDRRDPLRTTTYGVGELVLGASRSARPGDSGRLVLGLGGSATVDGGAGMAEALGWRLLDAAGRAIPRGGRGLGRLARIVPPAAPAVTARVIGLADVATPLLGPGGAAAVFGPQKGADAAGVRRLEEGLARLAERIEADLGHDVRTLPGGGAAGGLGAGVVAFLGGSLAAGSDWVLDAVGYDAALDGARLVITGEGSYDAQTGLGKVVGTAIERAVRVGVPVLLVAGRIEAAPPEGVVGVDGGGAVLDRARLSELVAAEAPALLR